MNPVIEDRENVGVLKTEFHVSSLLIFIAPFIAYVQDTVRNAVNGANYS